MLNVFGRELIGVVIGATITFLFGLYREYRAKRERLWALGVVMVTELIIARERLALAKTTDEMKIPTDFWDAFKVDLVASGIDPSDLAELIVFYQAVQQWNRDLDNETYGGATWTRPEFLEIFDYMLSRPIKSKRMMRAIERAQRGEIGKPERRRAKKSNAS